MSPFVYQIFQQILASTQIAGPILEIGATPGKDCLLNLPCLENIHPKIGIHLEEPVFEKNYHIIQGNANHMPFFKDNYFHTILCNSSLEHDPYFWKTLSEIYRITAPGGLIIIGVPGFSGMGMHQFLTHNKIHNFLLCFLHRITRSDLFSAGTVTLGEHFFPGDYYRFTEQAMKEIFFQNCVDIQIYKVMQPLRLIGAGRKK